MMVSQVKRMQEVYINKYEEEGLQTKRGKQLLKTYNCHLYM